ncbi:Uncharacterised protein [Clostridium putrefaciens]|uniref:ABC transporter permease n=1 Tax=Clostridium putrefaciens TaxID=99675 RepID=A0A381J5J1_9CLOT|nr:hypothetical protein [Clostridium putrefaciens]SUY45233.1 Uncharacterised protein [Clostridium putrefaciens]
MLIALFKYNYKIYIKCNKFLIPLLIFCIFQLIFYGTDSVDFTSSIIICANVVFFMMTWIGFSYCETQDFLTEQIVFLKVNNNKLYWVSKILFMWMVGIIVSLIATTWPLAVNLLNNGNGSLFNNGITLNNVLLGFFIYILVTFMGVILGMTFQTKITGNRNRGVMLMFLIALLSALKGPLIKEFPIAKAITWLLPPVYDVITSCMLPQKFSLSVLSIPVIYSVCYILIQIFIYIKLMKKLLF